ncbi:MAG: hypothetical protein EHM79_01235 [Geobacter sp.]|nr:MAG: hypothetical protein EHM79_01235 [Geobacter sp.]
MDSVISSFKSDRTTSSAQQGQTRATQRITIDPQADMMAVRKLSPEETAALQAYYNRTLVNIDRLRNPENLPSLNALSTHEDTIDAKEQARPYDPSPDASEIYKAMHGGLLGLGGGGSQGISGILGIGCDQEAIFNILRDKNIEKRKAIRDVYRDHYHRDLDEDLCKKLFGGNRDRYKEYMDGGRVNEIAAKNEEVKTQFMIQEYLKQQESAVQKGGNVSAVQGNSNSSEGVSLYNAFQRNDKNTIKKIMHDRSKEDLSHIREDYEREYRRQKGPTSDPNLEREFRNTFKGREQFDTLQELKGKPTSIDEFMERTMERYSYERMGEQNLTGRALMDTISGKGKQLDHDLMRALGHCKKAKSAGTPDGGWNRRLAQLRGYV